MVARGPVMTLTVLGTVLGERRRVDSELRERVGHLGLTFGCERLHRFATLGRVELSHLRTHRVTLERELGTHDGHGLDEGVRVDPEPPREVCEVLRTHALRSRSMPVSVILAPLVSHGPVRSVGLLGGRIPLDTQQCDPSERECGGGCNDDHGIRTPAPAVHDGHAVPPPATGSGGPCRETARRT